MWYPPAASTCASRLLQGPEMTVTGSVQPGGVGRRGGRVSIAPTAPVGMGVAVGARVGRRIGWAVVGAEVEGGEGLRVAGAVAHPATALARITPNRPGYALIPPHLPSRRA